MSELRWTRKAYLSAVRELLEEGGFYVMAESTGFTARRRRAAAQEEAVSLRFYGAFDEGDVSFHVEAAAIAPLTGDIAPVVMAVALVEDPTDEAVEAVQWFEHRPNQPVPVVVDLRMGELHFPMEWMYRAHFDLVEGFLLPVVLP